MVLQVAEIIFNDTPSKFNKDLTDFLKRNIDTIIMKGRIKFRFKVAKAQELNDLRNRGIKRLPAMIIGDRPYVGVPTIIEELRNSVKKSKKVAAPKSEEEVLREYFDKTLGEIKKDSDGKIIQPDDQEDENRQPDLTGDLTRELQRRGLAGGGDGGSNRGNRRMQQRPTPSKPSRDAIQDDDYEDRRPPPIVHRQQREDNVEVGDPLTTLENLQQRGGEDARDDDLMRQLLQKMGGGE